MHDVIYAVMNNVIFTLSFMIWVGYCSYPNGYRDYKNQTKADKTTKQNTYMRQPHSSGSRSKRLLLPPFWSLLVTLWLLVTSTFGHKSCRVTNRSIMWSQIVPQSQIEASHKSCRHTSQITSLTTVYSTVYSDTDQRKHQRSTSLAFVWGIHRNRWIPRTNGQLRGKCFHLMPSSCTKIWRTVSTCQVHICSYTIPKPSLLCPTSY